MVHDVDNALGTMHMESQIMSPFSLDVNMCNLIYQLRAQKLGLHGNIF